MRHPLVFIIIKINESLYILVMTRGGKHSLFQKLVAKTHARPLFLCNFNIAESYKKTKKIHVGTI